MSSVKSYCTFLGIELHGSLEGSSSCRNLFHLKTREFPKRDRRRCAISAKQSNPISQEFRFSYFSGEHLEFLRRSLVLRNGSRLKCIKESFSRSKDLLSYLNPLWKEGLLLIRASVYTAVISGICLLAWYGQNKAKGFIEAKLLPSVCSAISEYIQRDLEFGKVRRISPLGITLESCSFGPHKEEFSCGEAPIVKLRIRPFASLRRGKWVIDAVLSQPSVLVAQKKDFTWLGIPQSEGSIQRHLSTEEGIDHRTKIRRLAREEAGAQWTRERDAAAREAAEAGYYISEFFGLSEDDDLQEIVTPSALPRNPKSFFCMNEEKHDHHCMDTSVDYDMKHAKLEKSFGVKFPGSGLRFWSRVIKSGKAHKRKANGNGNYASSIAIKRRIFERSASAAHAYFSGPHGKFGDASSSPSECFHFMNHNELRVTSEVDKSAESVANSDENRRDNSKIGTHVRDFGIWSPAVHEDVNGHSDYVNGDQNSTFEMKENKYDNLQSSGDVAEPDNVNSCTEENEMGLDVADKQIDDNMPGVQRSLTSESPGFLQPKPRLMTYFEASIKPLILKSSSFSLFRNVGKFLSCFLSSPFTNLKPGLGLKVEDIVTENVDGVDFQHSEGITNMLPVTLDSVHFRDATVMLLAYGDKEVREMENVNGLVKFQNHYSRINVQLSGNCKTWRSDMMSKDGGWLSANVFVDIIEQKWHANLKIDNLFVPLFERILEIPITWSKGRASGEVHLCMSRGETFPNLHGQLDVTGLEFHLLDAPSSFSKMSVSLCFRGQRIFLHNANGWFGSIPLEASGDFGIHPEEGEFHLMCQVPSVEVNSLMRTFKMRPLLFPIAGSVTAVFNCQGPLDAPVFVGSAMVSRTFSQLHVDTPTSAAFEVLVKSKEAGALAAFDRVPFSYVSANFTFNTDDCVADLYGIRASLVDGGEIRGAGNAWICPEGEEDETALDVNFSGSLAIDKILLRYIPSYFHLMSFKLEDLNGETKVSGSLLKPRFDIRWTAAKAEGSFSNARGDIIISHESITVNSSSAGFDLYMRVQTSYIDDFPLKREEFYATKTIPFTIDGVELDLRMHGFEFFNLVSPYTFDSLRPLHLKATGRIKFQGKVLKPSTGDKEQKFEDRHQEQMLEKGSADGLVGEVSISGLKLNQLMLAPQLFGLLRVSPECIKLDASGRPDESLALEFVGPLQPSGEDGPQSGKLLSIFLQKGHLRANICFQPLHSANLEVRHFPLDELELASLRGTIQRAEIQLNLQKRRGHGVLSVLRPKFSGLLGEALDVAARWSGDVITIEKTVLEQHYSRYELQGEYVLPGTEIEALWRMKLEVSRAEVAEMLPLARLLSRSTDPADHSRSKDIFIQSLQSVGLYAEGLQQLLEVTRGHHAPSNDIVLEDLDLPGLSELKGRWHGSLDSSGGGNGDTVAEFDFHGEDWEWEITKPSGSWQLVLTVMMMDSIWRKS
ncbi:hypothetical protein K1719_025559 [Acacia pycnantha]|nr:hypothetical protein K1719_025559 [Acacia pycnantha]